MKSSAKRVVRHTFASIGHDTSGADNNSSRHRTSKGQSTEDALEHYLLSQVKENPMRLFCVGDIRTIFHMGKKTMTRLRKLAEKDPVSDPWEGDLTNPEQFAKWYWGKRRELQRQFPNINSRQFFSPSKNATSAPTASHLGSFKATKGQGRSPNELSEKKRV